MSTAEVRVTDDDRPICASCGEPVPTGGVASNGDTVQLVPGGRELIRVPAGVTAAELRAAGFPDVAAVLEGKVVQP